jgi:hypothetical protein
MIWSDDDKTIKADWDGKWLLNDKEDDIVFIEDGAEFELKTKDKSGKWEIEFEEKGGSVIRSFELDGKNAPFDDKAREWFHENVVFLMRETGLHAKERVARILKKDGPDAVISEMGHIRSDWALRKYSSILTDQASLKSGQIDRLIGVLAKIESDYEMRKAYTDLLSKDTFPAKSRKKVWKAAEQIESDYELRMLLTPFADKFDLDGKDTESFLNLAQSIESDYELRVLLSTTLGGVNLNKKNLQKLATLAGENIESDYEYRQLMNAFIERIGEHKSVINTVINGLATIESDYERRQLMKRLVKTDNLDQAGYEKLIVATTDMDSDYEKAMALIMIHNQMPKNSKTEGLIRQAAQSISSDYEQNRVLKKLRS